MVPLGQIRKRGCRTKVYRKEGSQRNSNPSKSENRINYGSVGEDEEWERRLAR